MAELLCIPGLVPGTVIEFDYPTHNVHNLPLEFVRRVVEVERMVSYVNTPLTLEQIRRFPMVRRGSTMVFGRDLTTGQRRKFYLEASRGARLPDFRLGIYDPESPNDTIEWVGRTYRNNDGDFCRMTAMMVLLGFKDLGRLRIAAFRVGSSLIGSEEATSRSVRQD